MSRIEVIGAGAFGSALAIALHRGGKDVRLVGRSVPDWVSSRQNPRLSDVTIPEGIALAATATGGPDTIVLLAIPMQSLSDYLAAHPFEAAAAVACCKGVDLRTGSGSTAILKVRLSCPAAILTGPSFAADIARGLPTALTLATDMTHPEALQEELSTEFLRLYLSNDPIGAELGGALKNVIAIACGICIGAGLGDSARAALMTRGFAEMQRLSVALGAKPETLMGLSGFGDLALTCTSELSRNFRYGLELGGAAQDLTGQTVEGKATAQAVAALAQKHHIEMPIVATVKAVVEGDMTPSDALAHLLARPLKKE